MDSDNKVVTPTMRKWVVRLLDPKMWKLHKFRRQSIDAHATGIAAGRAPNYKIVEQLESAGLIEWVQYEHSSQVLAVLTERGRSVAMGAK